MNIMIKSADNSCDAAKRSLDKKSFYDHVSMIKKLICHFFSGKRVYWHCAVDTSTTCIPCPASTYTDEPNRRVSCFPCTVCDPGMCPVIKAFIYGKDL